MDRHHRNRPAPVRRNAAGFDTLLSSATHHPQSNGPTPMPDINFIHNLQSQINAYLETCCDRYCPPRDAGLLGEAIRYCLLGDGKRLRPILVLAGFRAAGGGSASDNPAVLPAAATIEMVHTFSLIHDDLPAMDDDDLRRGRPTCHVRFKSEALAILAGDALATLPYLLIHSEITDRSLASSLVAELSEATMRMIHGQVCDTLGSFPVQVIEPAAQLKLLHELKTGALLQCACRMGALVAGADAALLDSLTRYGKAVGLMFQIVDDILDETQTTEHMGKRTHKDAAGDKLTYPAVHGLDASRAMVADLERQACLALESLGATCDTDQLYALASYLSGRTR